PRSMKVGREVTLQLHTLPEVRTIAQQAGRAELGEDTWGVEYSELEVDLEKDLGAEDAEEAQRALKEKLATGPAGFEFEVLPFLSERIKETLSGTTGAVVVKVYGNRLEDLDRAAQIIARALRQTRGSGNVHAEAQAGLPELVVRLRPQ